MNKAIRICALSHHESIEHYCRILGSQFTISNPTRSFCEGDGKRWFPYLENQSSIDADVLLISRPSIAEGGIEMTKKCVTYVRQKFPHLKVVVDHSSKARKEFLEAGAHLSFESRTNDEKTLADDINRLFE